MMRPAEFAKTIGVSRQAISKAIKAGRIQAYDATGLKVPADFAGQKFVDPVEARRAMALTQARIDDDDLDEVSAALDDGEGPVTSGVAGDGSNSLASARRDNEQLKAELLRMRIEQERGNLIDRTAALDALETAGRAANLEVMLLPSFAEEIVTLAHEGGVAAVTAALKRRAVEMCESIAGKLTFNPDGGAGEDIAA